MAKKRESRVLEEERRALMKSLSVKEFALLKECWKKLELSLKIRSPTLVLLSAVYLSSTLALMLVLELSALTSIKLLIGMTFVSEDVKVNVLSSLLLLVLLEFKSLWFLVVTFWNGNGIWIWIFHKFIITLWAILVDDYISSCEEVCLVTFSAVFWTTSPTTSPASFADSSMASLLTSILLVAASLTFSPLSSSSLLLLSLLLLKLSQQKQHKWARKTGDYSIWMLVFIL